MTINLENFFPTSQRDCKKLVSIINMDYDHNDELIQSIILWLIEEKDLCEHHAKEYANKYVDIRPKVREAEEKVKSMQGYINTIAAWKRTPEYKEVKTKFKEIQNEYRYLKNSESSYNSSFKKYHSRKEKVQKNIEILHERK